MNEDKIDDEFNKFWGLEDDTNNTNTLSFFKENIDELEIILEKAKRSKVFKLRKFSAYASISEFLFNVYGIKTIDGKPLTRTHIADCFHKARKHKNKFKV